MVYHRVFGCMQMFMFTTAIIGTCGSTVTCPLVMSSFGPTVPIKVLAFASARDRLVENGHSPDCAQDPSTYSVTVPSHFESTVHLRRFICQELWPCLGDIQQALALALNLVYLEIDESTPISLSSDDTLALIPPINGG